MPTQMVAFRPLAEFSPGQQIELGSAEMNLFILLSALGR